MFGYLEVTNWSTFYYTQIQNPSYFTTMLLVGGLELSLIFTVLIFSVVLAIVRYPKLKRFILIYIAILILSEVIVIILYGVVPVYWGFVSLFNVISNPNYLVYGAVAGNQNVLFYAVGLVLADFAFALEISTVIAVPLFIIIIFRDYGAAKKQKQKRQEIELDERIKKAIEKDRRERESS